MSKGTTTSNGKYTVDSGGKDEEEAVALTADTSFPTSLSSTRGTTSSEAEDELHDGCIVLGQDAGRGNRYIMN